MYYEDIGRSRNLTVDEKRSFEIYPFLFWNLWIFFNVGHVIGKPVVAYNIMKYAKFWVPLKLYLCFSKKHYLCGDIFV